MNTNMNELIEMMNEEIINQLKKLTQPQKPYTELELVETIRVSFLTNFEKISKNVISRLSYEYGNIVLKELTHLTSCEAGELVAKEIRSRNAINLIDSEIMNEAEYYTDELLGL